MQVEIEPVAVGVGFPHDQLSIGEQTLAGGGHQVLVVHVTGAVFEVEVVGSPLDRDGGEKAGGDLVGDLNGHVIPVSVDEELPLVRWEQLDGGRETGDSDGVQHLGWGSEEGA